MSGNEETRSDRGSSPAGKSTTDYPLPDKQSFDKQLELLGICVVASKQRTVPSSVEDILRTGNLKGKSYHTTLSFLKKVGFLTGERGQYQPTQDTIDLYYARKSQNADEIKRILRKIVSQSWFWESSKSFLDVKTSVSRDDLVMKLARDCKVDPDTRRAVLTSLVEYLTSSDLVTEKDGIISLNSNFASPEAHHSKPHHIQSEQKGKPEPEKEESRISIQKGSANISINLNIASDISEEQFRKLLRIVREELRES